MTTTQQLDLDTPSDFVSDGALDALGGRKAVNKPDISRLPDAFVGGIAQFKEGDKLVVERYASFLTGKPYLDTKTFRVERYDMATGRIHLFDEALDQNAMMDWHSAVKCGTVFKLAVGKVDISTKKKRGRPRKNPVEAPKEEAPQGEKRGRGRPKGAKNRAKEVIKAEKDEKKAKRAAKVAKRKPKKKAAK
jgi:hypothetical protein